MHLLTLRRRRRLAAPKSRDDGAAQIKLLDRAGAASVAGCSPITISRAVALWQSSGGRYGLRPSVQRPRMLRIDMGDLRDWIAGGMPTGMHGAMRAGRA